MGAERRTGEGYQRRIEGSAAVGRTGRRRYRSENCRNEVRPHRPRFQEIRCNPGRTRRSGHSDRDRQRRDSLEKEITSRVGLNGRFPAVWGSVNLKAESCLVKSLDQYLLDAEQAHGHLCAGQVLGVRLAMLGLQKLGIEDPHGKDRKRVVAFVEIVRYAADAIGVVTGIRLGKRALKFRDWG